ncbi:RraA family protein [Saccharomonospora sp. NPDC046836]|uniref:RraA family protein n=1 Tax=Saccharomonospora sp. NPDC046836 TaxID=3156921 RepID=UPI0033D4D48D
MDLFERAERINEQEIANRKQRDIEYEAYRSEGRVWGAVPREWIRRITFPRVDASIIESFKKLPDLTSSISDVLDSFGVRASVSASQLSPLHQGQRVVGQALTLRSVPERMTATQGFADRDFIKTSQRDIFPLGEPGDVMVSEHAVTDVSSLGYMATSMARVYGFAGMIVEGYVRDVNQLRDSGFPIWSRGVTPISGKFRMEAIEINGPITVHDIRVDPGDLIIADDAGICAIPVDLAAPVLHKVTEMCDVEGRLESLVEQRSPLESIRSIFRERYSK